MSLFLLQGDHPREYFGQMPKLKRFFFILALCGASLIDSPISSANDQWAEWQDAKISYDAQNWDGAIQTLQAHPSEEPNYFYNLGTLFFKTGNYGKSVAYLEKANRMNPHNPEIQMNLSIAKTQLARTMGSTPLDPASTWAEQLADRLSLDEVRATLGLLGLILVIFWTRTYLKSRDLKKAFFQPAGWIGLAAFSITAGMYGVQRYVNSYPPAISLQNVIIRSGPGESYLQLGTLAAGTKIRLLSSAPSTEPHSSSEIWQQVRYSQDAVGWVKAVDLLTL